MLQRALPLLSLWVLTACASGSGPRPAPRPAPQPLGPPPALAGSAVRADTEPAAAEGSAEPAATAPRDAAAQASTASSSAATTAELTAAADPTLALVGGRPIRASELLETWLQRDSPALKRSLNLLIGGRLAQLEATRLGLQLPPPLVAERFEAHLEEFRSSFLGEGENLDDFLREQLDLDPVRYRERLRADTVRELVTERVVRAHSLGNEHARVRILVVAAPGEAEALLARLRDGADFAELAREHSLDRTGERGGLLPFVARSERAPLSRLAFATPLGEVGGPVELGGAQVLLLVEARPAPLAGDWSDLGVAVEDSLLSETVTDEEFLVWQLAMERRYGVDVRPFYDLVHEPFDQP
jgi:hypothetical protein